MRKDFNEAVEIIKDIFRKECLDDSKFKLLAEKHIFTEEFIEFYNNELKGEIKNDKI